MMEGILDTDTASSWVGTPVRVSSRRQYYGAGGRGAVVSSLGGL